MAFIKLGSVRAFPNVKPDKEQALKVLEEASETFNAWQVYDHGTEDYLDEEDSVMLLMDELADTITACCNLAASLGVTNLAYYLALCEERNRRRGRYGD